MSNTLTYGDISQRTATYAEGQFLKTAQPMMVTQRFSQQFTQPRNSGTTRTWRRYNPFAHSTNPLVEAHTPEGHKMTYEDISVILREYGDLVELTQTIVDTHEDPILKEISRQTGRQAARTIEAVTFEVLTAGSNVYYAGGTTVTSRSDVKSLPAQGEFRNICRGFDRALAMPMTEIISPTVKVSTSGVESAFYALCHTDLDSDLRNMPGFKTPVSYGNPGSKVSGEIGAVERIRFISTTMCPIFSEAGAEQGTANAFLSAGSSVADITAKCDIYPIIVLASEAYATVRLQGRGTVKIMVVNPDRVDGANRMGRVGSVAWKTWYAAVILNQAWIARYEVACSAEPTVA